MFSVTFQLAKIFDDEQLQKLTTVFLFDLPLRIIRQYERAHTLSAFPNMYVRISQVILNITS